MVVTFSLVEVNQAIISLVKFECAIHKVLCSYRKKKKKKKKKKKFTLSYKKKHV